MCLNVLPHHQRAGSLLLLLLVVLRLLLLLVVRLVRLVQLVLPRKKGNGSNS
jgi:hypothetical protein